MRSRGLHNRLKYSEPSEECQNSSFSDYSSAEISDNPYDITNTKTKKSSYLTELESCRQEISKLRVKIMKMRNSEIKPKQSSHFSKINNKEIAQKLKKQREFLEKQFNLRLKQQREEVRREALTEIEAFRSKDFKVKGAKDKLKEVEEFYENEISLVEKEHEAKLRIKMGQVKAECERSISRVQEENVALKKLNEGLKRQLEMMQAKSEVRKNSKSDLSLFNTFDEERELKEIKEKYSELQKDYMDIKKREKTVLCMKCKAVAKADVTLNNKLEKLKNFLESDY